MRGPNGGGLEAFVSQILKCPSRLCKAYISSRTSGGIPRGFGRNWGVGVGEGTVLKGGGVYERLSRDDIRVQRARRASPTRAAEAPQVTAVQTVLDAPLASFQEALE